MMGFVAMGQVEEQLVTTGAGTAAAITGAALAPGAIATAAWAVPVIGAVAAVGLIIWGWIKKRNAQKVAATHVVDEAEPFLRQNRDAFLALTAPNDADKAQARANFDAVWAQVKKECEAIGGGGGERCILDRQPGGMWDWFAYYRTPIEQVQVTTVSLAQSLFSGDGSLVMGLSPGFLVGAALVAGGLMLL